MELYIVTLVFLLLALSVNCSLMHGYECYKQINELCVHDDLEGVSYGQAFVWRYPLTVVS